MMVPLLLIELTEWLPLVPGHLYLGTPPSFTRTRVGSLYVTYVGQVMYLAKDPTTKELFIITHLVHSSDELTPTIPWEVIAGTHLNIPYKTIQLRVFKLNLMILILKFHLFSTLVIGYCSSVGLVAKSCAPQVMPLSIIQMEIRRNFLKEIVSILLSTIFV